MPPPEPNETFQANRERIRRRLEPLALPPEEFQEFLRTVRRAPDPDATLNHVERLLAAVSERGDATLDFWKEAPFRRALLRVLAASRHVADTLCGAPRIVEWLRNRETWKKKCSVEELLTEFEKQFESLAAFQAHHLARIAFADVAAGRSLAATTAQIANLAEAVIQAALTLCAPDRSPLNTFVVLALGKLGGRELNYSSDIDLMFLCDNATTHQEADRHARLAQDLIAVLSDPSGQDHLYRVDMRLRPHGTSGPLVLRTAAAVTYYESRASAWELQALLKARPVAGNRNLGTRFLRQLRPLVCPCYPSAERIRATQAIKRRIEAETERRGQARTEVKTGIGGIRDIEFMVQFMQTLHGGRVPRIVHGNTLRSLALLTSEAFLTGDEAAKARKAYLFLRTVEHRLQLEHALQTHLLPADPRALARLARRCGLRGRDEAAVVAAFRARYAHHTANARAILDASFHNFIAAKPGEVDDVAAAILDEAAPPERLRAVMARYPFADPDAATANFLRLTRPASRFAGGSSRRTRHYLAAIAPALLAALAASPDPDMALINLERCTGRYGARATFYQLLAETPQALSLFANLCGSSQFLSELLIANPALLDPVIDALQTGAAKSAEQMATDLAEAIGSGGALGPALRDHYDREILRIGIRDIQEEINVRNVMDEISGLAESVVHALHGALAPGALSGGCDLCIVALGSLGAREMVYSSDLDLMFVYNPGNTEPGRAMEACSTIAQQLITECSAADAGRTLYRVDVRLRPSGSAGTLVTSLSAMEQYFERTAQLWEFMALAKARPIAGGDTVQSTLREQITATLRSARDRFDVSAEVMAMRTKVVRAAPANDIKRAEGGLVDLEFAVALLQLAHAADHPAILKTNTIDAILALQFAGLLSHAQVDRMLTACQFFRFLEDRLRIVHNIPGDRVPEDPKELDALARRMGYNATGRATAAGHLAEELRYNRKMTTRVLMELAKDHG